ncbi:branched-chain amino acid ABC transporter substrate-binding protein [Catenuloplanes atrovinosus]|uniref:Branched-chain amino acid transport system substrate-binding protein n=1 Tax=Catenuloplanes atrovinosus TaxID=137266 RepID=A0AAE3YV19_9ACTN|nr:branched-chain amino acid ABC transporter substrate-binding protein [Catenuloplanes atrovinosus]MDR7278496.1 branched-chain amino acid transport system substrate-binding protein [Catenuloplanes atrovinosus]
MDSSIVGAIITAAATVLAAAYTARAARHGHPRPAAGPGVIEGGTASRWRPAAAFAVVSVVAGAATIAWSTGLIGPSRPGGEPATEVCGRRIAVLATMTGSRAAHGAAVHNGVRLAVDAHNAAHPGCPIDTLPVDQGDDVPTENVIAVVHGGFSAAVADSQATLRRTGIPLLAVAAADPVLTVPGTPNLLRLVGNTVQQAERDARYLDRRELDDRVTLVADGSGMARHAVTTLRRVLPDTAFDEVAVADASPAGIADAVALIRDSAPDAVYVHAPESVTAGLAARLRELGIPAPLVTPSGWPCDRGPGDPGVAGVVYLHTCPPTDHLAGTTDERARTFATDYRARFGDTPTGYAASAYDAATLILRAVSGGHTSGEALAGALRTLQGEGVSGGYRFTPDGDRHPDTLTHWSFDGTTGTTRAEG